MSSLMESTVRRMTRLTPVLVVAALLTAGCGSADAPQGQVPRHDASLAEVFDGRIPSSVAMTAYGADELYVAGVVRGEGIVSAICDAGSSCRPTDVADARDEQSQGTTLGFALASSPDGEQVVRAEMICRLGELDVCDAQGRVISLVDVSPGSSGGSYDIEPALFRDVAPTDTTLSVRITDDQQIVAGLSGPGQTGLSGPGQTSTVLTIDGRSAELVAERELPGVLEALAFGDDGAALVLTTVSDVPSPGYGAPGQEPVEPERGIVTTELHSLGPSGEHRRLGPVDATDDARVLPLAGSLVRVDPVSGQVRDLLSGEEAAEVTPLDTVETDRHGGRVSCSGSPSAAVAIEFAYDEERNRSLLWLAGLDGDDLRSLTHTVDGVVSAANACSINGRVHLSTTSHPVPGLERSGDDDVLDLRVLDLRPD